FNTLSYNKWGEGDLLIIPTITPLQHTIALLMEIFFLNTLKLVTLVLYGANFTVAVCILKNIDNIEHRDAFAYKNRHRIDIEKSNIVTTLKNDNLELVAPSENYTRTIYAAPRMSTLLFLESVTLPGYELW